MAGVRAGSEAHLHLQIEGRDGEERGVWRSAGLYPEVGGEHFAVLDFVHTIQFMSQQNKCHSLIFMAMLMITVIAFLAEFPVVFLTCNQ